MFAGSVRVRRIGLMLTMLVVAMAPPAAAAKTKQPPKPSIKVSGISVNMQDFKPGTKVTQSSPINACVGIGGTSLDPQSLTAVAFVHAVKIPRSASTTVDFTTPWASAGNGEEHKTDTFSRLLFQNRQKSLAPTFGGTVSPNDFYTYLMLPTGFPTGSYIDGGYTFSVSAKVGGKTLRSSGAITIAC